MTKEEIAARKAEIKAAMKDPNLCAGTASTFSRISGYYRDVANWNVGKVAEFKDRKNYGV